MTTSISAVVGSYPHVDPIKSGEVSDPGIEFTFLDEPFQAANRAMVTDTPYDVCEMAMTTVVTAIDYPQGFTALPVFLARSLPFDGLACRSDAGIRSPKDLEGKRVGVRAITGTGVFWIRDILYRGYGVDLGKVTWITTDTDYIQDVRLPGNVEVMLDANLSDLLSSGAIDAAINSSGSDPRSVEPMFPEPVLAAEEWLKATGVLPINHVIVVRNRLLETDPSLATRLVDLFVAAKAAATVAAVPFGPPELASVATKYLGDDLLPYGIEANRVSLEACIDAAAVQGLISTRPSIESLFPPSTTV